MAGPAELECDPRFEFKDLMIFKAPGEVFDPVREFFDLFLIKAPKAHGVGEHGDKKGLCRVGADDFTCKTVLEKVGKPANMVNMGVGQKEVIDVPRLNRPVRNGNGRVIPLGNAAVDHDMYSCRLKEMTGPGDAVFSAKMSDGIH